MSAFTTISMRKIRKACAMFIVLAASFLPATAFALLPFETTGNIYVSMWVDDEIAIFQPDGTALERFTAEGLDGPRGIAFNPANGEIWIASEFSNSLFIFNHEHEFLRKIDHQDFDEPVGITFAMTDGIEPDEQEVFVSNSNGNEIMVFDQSGNLIRRFTGTALRDPNCSAFMQDGSLFVANRLGGTTGSIGAVSTFDTNENFQFDFTTDGIASLMAVARDPNAMPDAFDDTLWVTSGGGATGIYEFDQNGNLLSTLLPADIDDGRPVVPQGIAFDDDGNFYVVSFLNEVIKFDGDGNYLARFSTGEGTARSMAVQACAATDGNGQCVPLGVNANNSTDADNSLTVENTTNESVDGSQISPNITSTGNVTSGGGGGSIGLLLIGLILLQSARIVVKMPAGIS